MIPELVEAGLIFLGYNFDIPKRLEKDRRSPFEKWCGRIAPYVIFISIVLMIILSFIVLIRFGGVWFGTEANRFYNGGLV